MIIVNMASSIFLFRFHSILEMSDFQEINIELREAGRYITDINSMVISMSWIYTYIHMHVRIIYVYVCTTQPWNRQRALDKDINSVANSPMQGH